MNTLQKNKIKLNWFSAYAGLYKGWITPVEILKYIDGDFLKELDDTTIVKLYSDEHKSDEFF